MLCHVCNIDSPYEWWEIAGGRYAQTTVGGSSRERCPNCNEPHFDDYIDGYDPSEEESSPLDSFVQEIFQPGDEETLSG
jgi:hypothetical protein